jgi:hypothetical protein
MANTKWIKWVTGTVGVLIFSGFIGYLSKENESLAPAGGRDTAYGSVPDASSGDNASPQDELNQQWQSSLQGGDAGSPTISGGTEASPPTSNGEKGFGHRGRGGFVAGGGQGQGTDDDDDSFRTRAS